MAREFKLLALLWLVAACLAVSHGASSTSPPPTTVADPKTSPAPPPTTVADPKTSPAPPPTTVADPKTSPAPPPTTAADLKTTPAPPPTTVADTKTTPAPPPTTVADPKTTPAPPPTTVADPKTTPAPPPTTAADPKTTPAPPPTTAADPKTTPAPPPTTAADPKTTPAPPPTTAADPKTTPPPPTTTDPCNEQSCGDGSTCQSYAGQKFDCLCLAGDYYNYDTKSCEKAKVFPGYLNLPAIKYTENMKYKNSTEFLNAQLIIIEELSTVFRGSEDYHTSIVLDLQPTNIKAWSRAENNVNATVEIFFAPNSGINTTEVKEKIIKGCPTCPFLKNSNFRATKLCDKRPCDDKTTDCVPLDGSYACTCRESYIKTDFSSRICIACPSGQKAQGSDECVYCSFGYSGLNCSEYWQLALVIVSSVLGALLLITLILLPILASKSSKKSSKKNEKVDIGKPYVSHSPVKAPLVNSSFAKRQAAPVNGAANGQAAYANAGVPRIPRATTTSSWDGRTNLEMTPSNSRQNLVPVGRDSRLYDDQDDMNPYAQSRPQSSLYAQARPQNSLYAQARPQINPYAQNRPQTNPYDQNRPQTNPYASSQGHTNPYYMHDDGRRLN